VRRPARVDGASFRPRLATTPLPSSSPSAPRTPGTRTFTSLVLCHARHTRPASAAAHSAVRCMLLILIEAPSLTYHVVGWAWEKLTKERRRPQAILHQAAPVLLRHRSTCPQHVPLYLKPGWRDSAPPEHARWPRTVSEGRRTLPGRSGRLCRMDSSPGSGWPTSVRAKGCRLCSATRSI
jgi:hypothetical protein